MKTAVVLVEGRGGHAEADALQERLARPGLDANVLRVKAGASAAARAGQALVATGAEFAVFVACGRDDDNEFEETTADAVRAAHLDPLNVGAVSPRFLELSRRGPRQGETLVVLVQAAVAAARDARGLPTEARQFRRIAGAGAVSRRDLLRSLVRPTVRTVPTVDAARCVAKSGCRSCADACPAPGMVVVGGRARVDPAPCIGCGRCAVACPTSAVALGPAEPAARAARLRARGTAGLDGAVVVASPAALDAILESGAGAPLGAPLFPLHVPCAGAVSAAVLLWAARRGVPLLVFPCPPGSPCGDGCAADVARNVHAAQVALRAAGRDGRLLQLASWPRDGPGPWAWLKEAVTGLGTPTSTPGVALPALEGPDDEPASFGVQAQRLLRASPSAATDVDDPALPLGVVTVQADACTLCGLCSESCRPGALGQKEEAGSLRLAFDATACTACGACAGVCPEGALHLERRLDPARLCAGPTDLAVQATATCTACGRSLGSVAVLAVVRRRAGTGSGEAWERIFSRCADCRLQG